MVPELINIILGLRRLWLVAVCLMPAAHPQTIKQPQISSIVEGSLEVNNMDRWKSRGGKSQKRREEERRSEKRKSQKKEDAGARKGRKVAIHCVFPMICGSGGSKSRLAKAAGTETSGQMNTSASEHF